MATNLSTKTRIDATLALVTDRAIQRHGDLPLLVESRQRIDALEEALREVLDVANDATFATTVRAHLQRTLRRLRLV